jgi:hypothetical protein
LPAPGRVLKNIIASLAPRLVNWSYPVVDEPGMLLSFAHNYSGKPFFLETMGRSYFASRFFTNSLVKVFLFLLGRARDFLLL